MLSLNKEIVTNGGPCVTVHRHWTVVACRLPLLRRKVIFNIFANLLDLVYSDAFDVLDFHHDSQFRWTEFTDDGRWLVTLLLLGKFVTLHPDHALNVATIDGLLVEFLVRFECDAGILEGGLGVKSVGVAVFEQLN